ncbi:ComEC/Rec2 family competence protein [Clostridium paraputrificum]|uniref:ComEC/Rec2 family competence protein n=1 Tax=Clostridium paraputrificum TaxID=29363 RepID=UPI003D325720
MSIKDIEQVKMPIIYISLSLILSSICYGLYNDYWWLAVSSASLFFIGILIYTNSSFTFLISMFFILGIFINHSYYKVESTENFSGKLRVTEDKGYYRIGEFNGKRFYIEGDSLNIGLGERAFIYGELIAKVDKEKGILGTINIINGKKLSSDIISILYDIRKNIFIKLKENIGMRKAGLVTSLSFGYSDYLDTEDKEDMQSFGIIHAISVSGLHVALIFSILNKLFNKGLSLGVTTLYVLLTGAPFSSIRALIMIYCITLAFGARKKYNPLGGLALSGAIIILIKPYAMFQIGCILSFLATLGIILLSNSINYKLYKLPKYIRETIGISLGAQVLTLPVMMVAFGEFSLTFIIGNVLLIPILNILVLLGNLLLIAFLIPNLFDFISYIMIKIIYFLDRVMDYMYKISSSSFIVNENMVIIYVSAIISIYFIMKGHKKFIILPIISIIIVSIYIYSPIVRVDYLREGGILISYKGDRKIVSNKRNIDMERLKKTTLASEGYREGKNISIKDEIKIEALDKDFILRLNDKEYLLRLNKKGKIEDKYDIINFVEGKKKGFFIRNNRVLLY